MAVEVVLPRGGFSAGADGCCSLRFGDTVAAAGGGRRLAGPGLRTRGRLRRSSHDRSLSHLRALRASRPQGDWRDPCGRRRPRRHHCATSTPAGAASPVRPQSLAPAPLAGPCAPEGPLLPLRPGLVGSGPGTAQRFGTIGPTWNLAIKEEDFQGDVGRRKSAKLHRTALRTRANVGCNEHLLQRMVPKVQGGQVQNLRQDNVGRLWPTRGSGDERCSSHQPLSGAFPRRRRRSPANLPPPPPTSLTSSDTTRAEPRPGTNRIVRAYGQGCLAFGTGGRGSQPSPARRGSATRRATPSSRRSRLLQGFDPARRRQRRRGTSRVSPCGRWHGMVCPTARGRRSERLPDRRA